jgi:lipopolysaccharide export system permease protein
VRLYRRDDLGRPELSIEADLVTISADGIWHFEQASVRRFQPDLPEAAPEVQIGVDLPLAISDQSDAILLDADAGALPLQRLREYIAANSGRSYPGSEASLLRLRRLLHERLAAPVTVLVFGLLAVPLGLRPENARSLGPAAVRAVTTLVGFFLLRSLAASLTGVGLLPPVVASWAVLSGFALWGGLGLLQATRS